MANRSEVFTIAGSQTTSNEIITDNDGLFSLQIPAAGFDGTNLAVHARVRPDSDLKALYVWDGTSRTQLKLTGVAANDLLWFQTPVAGVYSIALVADSQTGSVSITPSWGKVLG